MATLLKKEGRMLLEGRKEPRVPERMLVQISAVHDPRLEELASIENLSPRGARIKTERSWEPGCHVDVKTNPGQLRARARVVYCQAVGPKTFMVGLNFLQPNVGEMGSEPTPAKEQQ